MSGEFTPIDAAYFERNQIVAALARIFPSGTRKTDIAGWDPAWQNCVFIDLPTGQVSWHYHDREAHLFESLRPYTKPWDGHTTPEKYDRLKAFWAPDPEPVKYEYDRTLGKDIVTEAWADWAARLIDIARRMVPRP